MARIETNLLGWRTNRKILVFESDDWGSIRMPSRDVYEKLLVKGYRVDNCPYNRNDSLASEDDLNNLFEALINFKDHQGNHPVFTANTIVANPDFEKIKEHEYGKYYYEPFTSTLQGYPKHSGSFKLWLEGIKEGIFYPQFHGREHLNIKLWMHLLKSKNKLFIDGFNYKMWGFGPAVTNTEFNIQSSFNSNDNNDIENHRNIISDGLKLFVKIFKYKSESFIATNFVWDPNLEYTLAAGGVKILKTMKYQKMPDYYQSQKKLERKTLGKQNKYKQIYLIRNISFEPSQMASNYDNVGNALKEIQTAFLMKKPAIIDTHRLNYIGFINEENRSKNTKMLKELISAILKKWPDVEFMNTSTLAKLIKIPKK